MPWKEQRAMNQKLEFIEKAGARGANISALCREYGISRQTGHKWLRRFRAQGKHRPHRAEPPAAHKPAHDCRGGHRKHPRAARATLEPQSFRFTPEQAATIKEEAKRLGSTTAFVRELIDDYRTMFGLPNIQVEVLQADMKSLKIETPREYVRHLLALRYQTLLEERAAGPRTAKR